MTSLPDEFAKLHPQPSPELLARLAELDDLTGSEMDGVHDKVDHLAVAVEGLIARLATLDGLSNAFSRLAADVADLDVTTTAESAHLGGLIDMLTARLDGFAVGNRALAAAVARLDKQINPPPVNPVGPSGFPMPTTDPAGMTRVFADDFTAYPNVPIGQFPAATNGRWSGAPNTWLDTSHNGHYNMAKTCSIVDGVLDLHVWSETVNGVQTNYSAAPWPIIKGNQPTGVINGVDFGTPSTVPVRANIYYGQIEFAFRCAQSTAGFKTAWLLWPDKGTNTKNAAGAPGGYGEIDVVEGNMDGTISSFHHRDGATVGNDQDVRNTGVSYTNPKWHIAKAKWGPNFLEFYLDDVKQGATITSRVDRMPMHWVFQTETRLSGGPPPAGSQGRMQIDWVVIHQLDGIYPA